MAFINFVKTVQENIFERIQTEWDDIRCETMWDENVGDGIDDIIQEEINDALPPYDVDIEECINDYGIRKAIKLYINTFGAIENADNITAILLHNAVQEEIDVSWNAYSSWAYKDAPDCEVCDLIVENPIKCICGNVICEECYNADNDKWIDKEHHVYGCGDCDDILSGRKDPFKGDVFAKSSWDIVLESHPNIIKQYL